MKIKQFRFFIVSITLFLNIQAHDAGDTRYQLIQSILTQYQRPCTVLDFGAREGYYTFRIAHDYQAVCVMIEANSSSNPTIANQLLQLCVANANLTNIIFLNKMFTPQELWRLSDCEKFDVVLAMNNVLNRFGDYWQEPFDAFLNMADNIIIEIKPVQETENIEHYRRQQAIQKYILEKNGQLLSTQESCDSLMYWIKTDTKYIQRKTWLLPQITDNSYKVDSSFSEKKLIKQAYWPPKTQQETAWIPGINMLTFKMCNGVYPTIETIKKSLDASKDVDHTDWMVNNMILQGNSISWIDAHDSSRQQGSILKPDPLSETRLRNHNTLLDMNDAKKIEHYFWYTLLMEPTNRKQLIRVYSALLPSLPTIFDINSDDEELLDVYLGLGARKVISFNLADKDTKHLEQKFARENVFMVSNEILKKHLPTVTIDTMMKLYGRPNMCNIHACPEEALNLLRGMSTPIPSIVFDFDIKALDVLANTLDHLSKLGYARFNFSVRHIPYFGLDNNPHTGVKKDWVKASALIEEIKQFAALDYAGEHLWGRVYAQYS